MADVSCVMLLLSLFFTYMFIMVLRVNIPLRPVFFNCVIDFIDNNSRCRYIDFKWFAAGAFVAFVVLLRYFTLR